jgi:hypothetical protein
MGLAERRASKEFQDTAFAPLKAKIDRAAGFPVTLEVKWDQLAKEDAAHGYADSWPKIYFNVAIAAFESIGRDQMGKDALKAGLKLVVFQNTANHYSASSAITFSSGVLTIDHDPYSNVDYEKERTDYTIALLEKGL